MKTRIRCIVVQENLAARDFVERLLNFALIYEAPVGIASLTIVEEWKESFSYGTLGFSANVYLAYTVKPYLSQH